MNKVDQSRAGRTPAKNHIIDLTPAETALYKTRSEMRDSFRSNAEQQAVSRQCDVYLIASDGHTLYRAWPHQG